MIELFEKSTDSLKINVLTDELPKVKPIHYVIEKKNQNDGQLPMGFALKEWFEENQMSANKQLDKIGDIEEWSEENSIAL